MPPTTSQPPTPFLFASVATTAAVASEEEYEEAGRGRKKKMKLHTLVWINFHHGVRKKERGNGIYVVKSH